MSQRILQTLSGNQCLSRFSHAYAASSDLMNKFCPIWPRCFGILFSFSAEHRRPRHCFSDVDLRLCLVPWSLVLFFYASHLAAPVTLSQSCLALRLLIRLQFCFSIYTCSDLPTLGQESSFRRNRSSLDDQSVHEAWPEFPSEVSTLGTRYRRI